MGEATSFRAGAAALPISPLPRHIEEGVYLGGYGYYQGRRAEGVHDDTFCRALALGDGGSTLLLLALDLVGLSPRALLQMRRALARRAGLPVAHVLVACTHSHASQDTQGLWGGVPDGYLSYLQERCLQAAREALSSVTEARLDAAAAVMPEGLVRNRRGWDRTDTTITALRARRPDGSTVATLVNFACHPTVTPDANLRISSDFATGLVRAIEADQGGIAIYVNGAQGDVNPEIAGDFGEAEDLGRRFAQAAIEALASAAPLAGRVDIQERRLEIPFQMGLMPGPVRKLLPLALPVARFAARRGLLRRASRRMAARGDHQTATVIAGLAMAADGPLKTSGMSLRVATRVSSLRIGEGLQALAAPGEVLTRLALPLKESLPGPHRLWLGLTNDTLGYFLPVDEWMTGRNGNYEESVSVGREAGPALASALRALMEEG